MRRPLGLAVSFAAPEDIVVYNYLKDVKVEIDLTAFELLYHCSPLKTVDELARDLPDWSREDIAKGMETLLEHQLLLVEGDEYDRGLERWDDWDGARLFHFWTRSAFATPTSDSMRQDEDGRWRQVVVPFPGEQIRKEASPPPFKRYPDAPRVYLPRAFLPLTRSYEETLLARRTARNFSRAEVGLRELSTLLHLTFAPMYMKDDGDLGILQVRTSPAGGSRHEAECYLGVLAVEGLPSGLYHYCAVDHSLELLRAEFTREMAVAAGAQQEWLRDVACVFYVTALFERMRWKYPSSSAYKVLLLNAGFLGQTFALTATALGLDYFQTAAIDCARIEHSLGVDPLEEGVTLMMACGRVRPEDRHLVAPTMMQPTTIPLVRDYPLPR
jgi:SagB-type dehydrogenase family enzyme